MQARVGDIARHRADIGIGAEEIGRLQVRDRPERCLETDHAAAGGGNADRAAAIRAKRDRTNAGCHRDRGASARAAAGVILVPGIERAGRRKDPRCRLVPELRRGGLADQNGAGCAHARDRRPRLQPEHDSRRERDPCVVATPSVLVRSLTEKGMPMERAERRAAASCRSAALASFRARSAQTAMNALRSRRASMRASAASTASTGEICFGPDCRPRAPLRKGRRLRSCLHPLQIIQRPPSISKRLAGDVAGVVAGEERDNSRRHPPARR